MGERRRQRCTAVRQHLHWPRKYLIGTKCVVDKLMDGSVDNPMDNLVPRLPPG
jgi:hypothetical protein